MGDNKQESDIPTPPSWMNKDLIEKALRNDGEENAEVTEVSIRLATAPGDNYASTIYRVKAALADGGERSVVVKGPAKGAMISEATKQTGAFKRESLMLTEVIPQMQALLEDTAPGRFPPLAARCPLFGAEPEEYIVMEDLGASGFRIADRKKGLGLRHCLLAVRALARYHAASHALLLRRPELNERLDNLWNNMQKTAPGMRRFVEGSVQAAADACRSWEGFERYGDMLEKVKDGAMDMWMSFTEPRPEGFQVIQHSDFWVNNMMFRYEEDTPQEIRLVDLQLSHVGSPAYDLLYFLGASTSEFVHTNHQELLLREYHHELKEVLSLLGLQAPSFGALQEEVDWCGPLSVVMAVGSVPIMRAEQAADIEGMLQGNGSTNTAPLQQPQIKRWFQRVIPDYARRGWLPE